MIIPNGYIVPLQASGGGLDPETGHPVRASEVESSKSIPCQYQSVSLDLLAKSSGESAIRANYTILIENYAGHFGERLALKRRDGSEVGRFSIIRVEPLDAVCQVRITV